MHLIKQGIKKKYFLFVLCGSHYNLFQSLKFKPTKLCPYSVDGWFAYILET